MAETWQTYERDLAEIRQGDNLMHRVKYGGSDRETKIGVGSPFLGLRVANIPNLSLLQSLKPFEK